MDLLSDKMANMDLSIVPCCSFDAGWINVETECVQKVFIHLKNIDIV